MEPLIRSATQFNLFIDELYLLTEASVISALVYQGDEIAVISALVYHKGLSVSVLLPR